MKRIKDLEKQKKRSRTVGMVGTFNYQIYSGGEVGFGVTVGSNVVVGMNVVG